MTDQPADGQQWTQRYTDALMDTFGPPQRVLVRGEGVWVVDADGHRYLDLLGGIAVNVLGHAHPELTEAISNQLRTLGHVSNFFATPTQITLAERLLELARAPRGSKVFFTSSGTEAVEAAVKLTRRHSDGRRPRVLALEGAFHGRSLGALALTHKPAYREPFEPLGTTVEFLPFGDTEALQSAFAADGFDVAALFVEPVQGEAGVRPLPPGYLALARRLTRAHGSLLVLDEIQCGMGRTGTWFAHQHPGDEVVPDAMTVAKGLGGGFPVGALITYGSRVSRLLGRGQHGTTFGGNPVAAAAGLAVIDAIQRDHLLADVHHLGHSWRADLRAVDHPLVHQVRGAGLLIGVELVAPVAAAVVTRALDAGIIVNAATPTTLRLAPPYILTSDEADLFTQFLAELPTDPEDL
ncbi:MAG: acetylornithine transaminase [Micrococcales bacterium]|nr:acetylornithine transaminase [Micrococcales bacterium]